MTNTVIANLTGSSLTKETSFWAYVRDFKIMSIKLERPTLNVDSTTAWAGVLDYILKGKKTS